MTPALPGLQLPRRRQPHGWGPTPRPAQACSWLPDKIDLQHEQLDHHRRCHRCREVRRCGWQHDPRVSRSATTTPWKPRSATSSEPPSGLTTLRADHPPHGVRSSCAPARVVRRSSSASSSARSSTSSSGACRAGESVVSPPSRCPAAERHPPTRQRPGAGLAPPAGQVPRLRRRRSAPATRSSRRLTRRAVRRHGAAVRRRPRPCRPTSTWRRWASRWRSSTSTCTGCRTPSCCRRYAGRGVLLGAARCWAATAAPAARAARRCGAVRRLLRAVLRLPGRHGLRRRQARRCARACTPAWLGWGALAVGLFPASCSAASSACADRRPARAGARPHSRSARSCSSARSWRSSSARRWLEAYLDAHRGCSRTAQSRSRRSAQGRTALRPMRAADTGTDRTSAAAAAAEGNTRGRTDSSRSRHRDLRRARGRADARQGRRRRSSGSARWPCPRARCVTARSSTPTPSPRAIKQLWAQAKFSSKKVVVGVANQKVVVRQVDLPWLPLKRAAQVARLPGAGLHPDAGRAGDPRLPPARGVHQRRRRPDAARAARRGRPGHGRQRPRRRRARPASAEHGRPHQLRGAALAGRRRAPASASRPRRWWTSAPASPTSSCTRAASRASSASC